MNLTMKEQAVLDSLRQVYEGVFIRDGQSWGNCYLDNAYVEGLTPRGFAAVLGSLQKKGLYRADPFDAYFGDVKLEVNR